MCSDAVISVQTMDPKGYQYPCAPSRSLSLCMCVCDGGDVATQTEATLISVLESNLACVQNGSLYQLGGSLPCLESGGSSSSGGGGGDASLMTALREQPDDHLLQRPAVCRGRTKEETICVLLLMIWLWSIIWMTRIDRYHFKGSQGCCVWMIGESLREDSYRFFIDLCITVVYLH